MAARRGIPRGRRSCRSKIETRNDFLQSHVLIAGSFLAFVSAAGAFGANDCGALKRKQCFPIRNGHSVAYLPLALDSRCKQNEPLAFLGTPSHADPRDLPSTANAFHRALDEHLLVNNNAASHSWPGSIPSYFTLRILARFCLRPEAPFFPWFFPPRMSGFPGGFATFAMQADSLQRRE